MMPASTSHAAPVGTAAESRAVRAWRRLQAGVEPTGCKTLQRRHKATTYRLSGVGHGGGPVIAKRCSRRLGAVEHAVYQEVLPQLSIRTLRYYGRVDDEKSSWLFVEDAGDEKYDPTRPEHVAAAASWLGALHRETANRALPPAVPPRHPSFYRTRLRVAGSRVCRIVAHPRLTAPDRDLLEQVVRQLDALESCWPVVERLCEALPAVLVHEDFQPKNIRVHRTGGELVASVFDWEWAGAGLPASDLIELVERSGDTALDAYWCAARTIWPECRRAEFGASVERVGVCHWAFVLEWASFALEYELIGRDESTPPSAESLAHTMNHMRRCHRRLGAALDLLV